MTPFRRLVKLFYARFFENDLSTPEGGFESNISQLLGIIGSPGLLISIFAMPMFFELALRPFDAATQNTLRVLRMFFPAFSFAVVGLAAFFEWDKLFPDRRDFYVLGPLPVPLKTFLAARFTALCLFLAILTAMVNAVPDVLMPVSSMSVPAMRAPGFLLVLFAQLFATSAAAAFAFFAVSAVQGVLINITTPRFFRRISPWIQAIGMSVMIIILLMFPVYSMLLGTAAHRHAAWLWWLPPVWFTGIYDLLLPPWDPLFADLGKLALLWLAGAIALFGLTWGLGFGRHYRRTLESEDSRRRRPHVSIFNVLPSDPRESAIFRFAGRTLARSSAHRMFLACYWSAGLSIALLATVMVRNGHLGISQGGLRSAPFLIVFFVVSGYRAAFQFPAELPSNWIFRLTEERWAETSRRATRKRVLASGLIPVLIAFLPFEIAEWGAATGMLHFAFQLATGALLIELLFWTFPKVPFTCSYYPGRVNLAMLVVIYLYGFTTYSFKMSDLQISLEQNAERAVGFFAIAAGLLWIFWSRRGFAGEVMFDAREPEIQTLDLT